MTTPARRKDDPGVTISYYKLGALIAGLLAAGGAAGGGVAVSRAPSVQDVNTLVVKDMEHDRRLDKIDTFHETTAQWRQQVASDLGAIKQALGVK